MSSVLLLAYMLQVSPTAGWILHFVVGISFALIYTFLVMQQALGKGDFAAARKLVHDNLLFQAEIIFA